MPKDHFSIDNVTSLSAIPEGGQIHVIGVAGVAMGQLAVALTKKGYRVTGSDKRFYEPMGSFLKNSAVTLFEGYRAENVPDDVDLVVIGNAVSYGHDEVAVVEERNLPYSCFPAMLFETVISGKHSIVACGTHGKSTTTALAAGLLHTLGKDPSYFIGGVCHDLPQSLHLGGGDFSVVEGDEYDSAFFAKVPKFVFYKPDTCIVNAIEFDHADIYESVDVIKEEFSKLILSMSANGTALCCIDFEHVKELSHQWKKDAACRVYTFGEDADSDFRITSREATPNGQTVQVSSKDFGDFSYSTALSGNYNARNATAVVASCLVNGFSIDETASAITNLKGVKRRQETRFNQGGYTLIEDFAHHPTSVAETISVMKEIYPERRLLVAFEPRSAASRRKIFQQDYINAFAMADAAAISAIEQTSYDAGHELLDINQLALDISAAGTPCKALDGAETIAKELLSLLGKNDVILVMSNGSFGGLIDILENRLTALSN